LDKANNGFYSSKESKVYFRAWKNFGRQKNIGRKKTGFIFGDEFESS